MITGKQRKPLALPRVWVLAAKRLRWWGQALATVLRAAFQTPLSTASSVPKLPCISPNPSSAATRRK